MNDNKGYVTDYSNNTGKKISIVTGVTGQAGSYLSELLIEKGHLVIGVTRRSATDNTQNLSFLLADPNFELVEGDITDSFSVSSLINKYKPDHIYNMAAQSHVGTSFEQPGLTWDVTAKGVLNILEAIRYSGMSNHIRFVQASSSEMFGKNFSEKKAWNNEVEWLKLEDKDKVIKFQNEDTPFAPQSPYAIAKLAAHNLCRNYRDSYGIHASCAIMFNYESPRRGENFVTRKITKWIGEFKRWYDLMHGAAYWNFNYDDSDYITADKLDVPEGQRIIMEGISLCLIPDEKRKFPKLRLGNLDAYRDWGYAKDTMEAVWLMSNKPDPDDYVIATGRTHSVREFLSAAFNRIGIEDWEKYVVIDPKFYRPAEVDYLLGDASKAKKKLGWEPKTSFEELVCLMVEEDLKDD